METKNNLNQNQNVSASFIEQLEQIRDELNETEQSQTAKFL